MLRHFDQSLLEQLRISDVEVRRRLSLLGLTPKRLSELAQLRSSIAGRVDAIVDEFYEHQLSVNEIALLIADRETLQRLKMAQRGYILDLFSGVCDTDYVNSRLRIGMVHHRIGVPPKLFIPSLKLLKDLIVRAIRNDESSCDVSFGIVDTLDRLLHFDTTLVFDTYIDRLVREREAAKERSETYARSLEEKVAERTAELQEAARIDALTGVFNRRAMDELFRKQLAAARRQKVSLTVMYVDVDHFKKINDERGHLRGDEILRLLGQCLRSSIRETDVACRYGGDEFCLILLECDVEGAKNVRLKLVDAFAEVCPGVNLSCGFSETGPTDFHDQDALVALADENMYRAKRETCDLELASGEVVS